MDQDLTLQEQAQLRNTFIEAVTNGGNCDSVLEKTASAASSFTRRRMREESFITSVIPFTKINNSDLHELIDSEEPVCLFEMEAAQWNPKVISFNDTGDTHNYIANKYYLSFYTNTTPEWTKNVDYLRTYRSDVRQLIVDNSLRDLSRLRDVKTIAEVDEICGPVAGGVSEHTGLEQYVVYPGRLDRDNWVSCKNILSQRMLTNGVFLCNQITWSEFQRWNRTEAGGDISEKMFLEGNGAFKTAKIGDIPFVVTMKTDVVNNGIIYQFAPSNYLGKAGVLQEPTMYVKKDKDILRFSCREKIGVTFANTAAVQKVAFKDVTGVYGGDGRIVLTADANAAGTLVGGKVKDAIDTSEGYTNTQA